MLIGFDIGGTKCAVSVGRQDGDHLEILGKRSIRTDHGCTPYEILDQMCVMAQELAAAGGLAGTNFWKEQKVGISCGGPLDPEEGVILSPPNLPSWDEVPVIKYLWEKYGAAAALQNDANACALAEWRYGAGKGCRNMVFLTFGTGMGAGLILDGRLYRGACDMAGEIGHIRLARFGPVGYGKAGSFEGFCSGSGIARLGRMLAEERFGQGKEVSYCPGISSLGGITAREIAGMAQKGHEDAKNVYRLCGEMLGQGLSVLIDLLNPERIVLGSIYVRSKELLLEAMERKLEEECLPCSRKACRVVPAQLGEELGDYAALSIAAELGGQV